MAQEPLDCLNIVADYWLTFDQAWRPNGLPDGGGRGPQKGIRQASGRVSNRNQHAERPCEPSRTAVRPAKKGIKAADAITTILNDLKRS